MISFRGDAAFDLILKGLFDYAGMFPPAQRSFEQALAERASFVTTLQRPWMLGADIVLDVEHTRRLAQVISPELVGGGSFAVCVLVTEGLAETKDCVTHLMQNAKKNRVELKVAAFEVRVSEANIAKVLGELGGYADQVDALLALEPDLSGDNWRAVLEATLGEIAAKRPGSALKCRLTGPTAIGPERLAAAIALSADVGLPFKVTGGLHHPIPEPGVHPFSIGFLNVSAAVYGRRALGAALSEGELAQLLVCDSLTELSIKEDGFTWRGHTVSLEQLKKAQAAAHFSIGSCSLYEPDQDLGRLVG
ncbi:MAG: hypothetical protein ACK5Y6_04090 [Pseudomonadota bacterium]